MVDKVIACERDNDGNLVFKACDLTARLTWFTVGIGVGVIVYWMI